MLVDLFTYNPELEEAILTNFPGKIKGKQHYVDTSDRQHLYCFYGLEESQVNEFLKGKNYSYELRDSKTGKVISAIESMGEIEVN